jgi:hypothetical protein
MFFGVEPTLAELVQGRAAAEADLWGGARRRASALDAARFAAAV